MNTSGAGIDLPLLLCPQCGHEGEVNSLTLGHNRKCIYSTPECTCGVMFMGDTAITLRKVFFSALLQCLPWRGHIHRNSRLLLQSVCLTLERVNVTGNTGILIQQVQNKWFLQFILPLFCRFWGLLFLSLLPLLAWLLCLASAIFAGATAARRCSTLQTLFVWGCPGDANLCQNSPLNVSWVPGPNSGHHQEAEEQALYLYWASGPGTYSSLSLHGASQPPVGTDGECGGHPLTHPPWLCANVLLSQNLSFQEWR